MARAAWYLELRCPACGRTEVCGPEDVVRWLRSARKLRATSEPEPEILVELFRAAAAELACPGCKHVGLVAGPAREDDDAQWPGFRACAACGKAISRDRLAAIPSATLCSECQGQEERGRPKVEVEYCPKCGAPMKLRATRSGGVTRYKLVCTGDPPCRL